MESHLKIIGVLLIVLSLLHATFPKKFAWEKELKMLSLINRQLMLVHTFFIALVVFMIGVLCLYCGNELVSTRLGQKISFGLFVFWFIRLIFQIFIYSSELWKGKRLETGVHILSVLFWIYLSVVFLISSNVFYEGE